MEQDASDRNGDSESNSTGILLVNLGTPDSPAIADVRRYLREFLSDPYVIDLPAPMRFALVRGIILPFRPRRSAKAYRQVWTERGSPLRFHGEDLRDRLLDQALWDEPPGPIVLAMRYGKPSIVDGLDELRRAGVGHVRVFPMFPQYSESAWLTAAKYCEAAARERELSTSVVQPFYDNPRYLDAVAELTATHLEKFRPGKLLMSFHGLPERHIHHTDTSPTGHCLKHPDCCDSIGEFNRKCYRAHCYSTARGLAERLGLTEDAWEVSFQSRLGRTPWIQPFTDHRIQGLAATGCRRLAVVCPSFVADCLETIEEIGITGKKSFLEYGGEDLYLVPALNSEPSWVRTVVGLLRN